MPLERGRGLHVGAVALQQRGGCGWDCHPLGAGAGMGLTEGWDWNEEALPTAWLPGKGSRTMEGCAILGAVLGW